MPVREVFTRDPSKRASAGWLKNPWVIFALVQVAGIIVGFSGGGHGDPTVFIALILLFPGILVTRAIGDLFGSGAAADVLACFVIAAINTALFAVYRWTDGRLSTKRLAE